MRRRRALDGVTDELLTALVCFGFVVVLSLVSAVLYLALSP
jgi:hypothetical protein